ncbi:hypothetical protein SARC_07598 [Sphaeroforma arctica JP610]|uniref:OBG-type G domain-containing protein n=1 Tax=Sphaeroforma arctica JP610 TaxID=667725 RepID=A0A0L0FTC2_9EUKA|nr:hypothetical protein SARC_07598 [Sphaeroforma arctica JP610]KNC80032.1 hypothetical protein SARC_07598 [Sphaeroforma arctica JP610]|eukprot:XP_014153934.1 hypothetical protein SARC_07598 [Sphaeroforma arctica JP610]
MSISHPPGKRTMRVLCLHGGRQTAEIFRKRMHRLTPADTMQAVDFVYIDGPHSVHSLDEKLESTGHFKSEPTNKDSDVQPEGDKDSSHLRTWYTHMRNASHTSDFVVDSTSILQTLSNIKQVWNQFGPFSGLLGFSAGATIIPFIAKDPIRFPGLYFVIMASGADIDLYPIVGHGQKAVLSHSDIPWYIQSLHLVGDTDDLVVPSRSLQLAEAFHDPRIYRHTLGHCVPLRRIDRDEFTSFFKRQVELWNDGPLVEALIEEFEVLEAIFGDDFSSTTISQEFQGNCAANDLQFINCRCRLGSVAEDGDFDIGRLLDVRFTIGPHYPNQRPFSRIQFHTENDPEIDGKVIEKTTVPKELASAILEGMHQAVLDHGSEPMLFDMVQAANVVISASTWTTTDLYPSQPCIKTKEDVSSEDLLVRNSENADADSGDYSIERPPTPIDVDIAILRGSAANTDSVSKGSRGVWRFILGLVGKPSAGKSTFFNGATVSSNAKVASHPFTTIKPNVGLGWWHSPPDDRHIPLLIKDVAGLVPGASVGKGKGNQFLNDLLEADALIHVVDCSGRTDKEGNITNYEKTKGKERDTPNIAHDPLEDVVWVRAELHAWIFTNVKRKWEAIKSNPKKLPGMFSGYHASKWLVQEALSIGKMDCTISSAEASELWTDDVLNRTVSVFLDLRFPICLACNKMDVPGAEDIYNRIVQKHPNAVPVCAAAEVQLQLLKTKGKIEYTPGKTEFRATQGVILTSKEEIICANARLILSRFQNTGVLATLSKAVATRPPVMCFPVDDLDTFSPLLHQGRQSYQYPVDSICLRPGSTIDDVFNILCRKNEGSIVRTQDCGLQDIAGTILGGEFVRAEGCRLDGSGRRLLQRTQVVNESCAVLRIMATKKSRWQKARKSKHV